MKNSNITPTVEAGLTVAISIVLGLISTYLPVIGTLIDFFWSIPFAVLTVRLGLKTSTFALIASIIILSMFIGPVLTIRLALAFGFSGIALGFAVQKNFSAIKIFVFTLITSFATQIFSILLMFFVMDINFLDSQISLVRESFDETFALYESLGIDQSQINQAKSQVEPAVTLVSLIMPTILFLSSVLTTWICFYCAKWIFPKIGIYLPTFPSFSDWRFPSNFAYLMILSLLGLYWGTTRNLNLLYNISINANILATFVGFIQGLAVFSFIANRFNISKLIRRFFFVILIFNFMLFQIIAFIGLFDMLFDYRQKFSDRK